MEFLTDPASIAIIIAVGFVAGFIDAVVGGGGLLSIPALLTLGLPPQLALGTNKLAASFGSVMSAFTYYRQHFFRPAFWYHCALASFCGAVIGSLAVSVLSAAWLARFLPLLIIAMAIYTLLSPNVLGTEQTFPPKAASRARQWGTGLLLGGYDGFAGPGIGALWMVCGTRLFGMPVLYSCGLARAMTFTSNAVALTVFLSLGLVSLPAGLLMGLCMMAGAAVGARVAIRYGLPFIRPLFTIIVVLIAANLAWSAWQ